jgi:glyoxylase-like metal-dependent hydrolase (beta-lactamase superfamily II)
LYGDIAWVDEGFLPALGVHRLPVPVPFVEAGGPVNVFTLENPDGTFTLFDAGVNTPEGLVAVRAGAAEAGVDLGRVSRIIVSHGHIDHFGNAQQLALESGARIFIHDADREKVLGQGRFVAMLERHLEYFVRLGVTREALGAMKEKARGGLEGRAIDPALLEPLHEGMVFRFKHFDAQVLHCPGHTPGLICLHAAAQRLLFADDHLLPNVSPNPFLDLSQGEDETKFLALVKYVESARRVHALELDCVLPGHGPAFFGHRSLLDGLFEFYGRRQEKLLGWLRARPRTALELTEVLFVRPSAGRMIMMLSEVLANVEVLERDGRVRRELADGRWVFSAV